MLTHSKIKTYTLQPDATMHYIAEVAEPLGERIRLARKERGWSVDELARQSGVSPRQVWNIENGADAKIGTVLKLTSALGIGVEADAPTAPATVSRESDSISLSGGLEVIDANPRMVGKPVEAYVAAGHGGWDDATDREVVMLPEFLFGPNDVLIQVKGSSMTGENIDDGDYLIVERRTNNIAAHGELVVAWIESGLVIKRWYRRNGKKFLESANPEMGWLPREIKPDDVFEIQGIVRHIVKKAKHSRRKADESHASMTPHTNVPHASSVPSSASPSIRTSDHAAIPAGLTRLVDGFDDEEITDAIRERESPGSSKGRKPT